MTISNVPLHLSIIICFNSYYISGNYARMLQAILNKLWKQHLTKQQLYGHLPVITETINVRRIRHQDTAGEVRINSEVMCSYEPLHTDDQLEPTYSSSEPIRGVVLKTCRKQWTIEKGGESVSQGYLCRWRDAIMMMMISAFRTCNLFLSFSSQ